jgi:hypothetical protein
MKKRFPSLDEFINESLSAKEVAKALGITDMSNKEVSLWVIISNQFDEYDLEIFQALTEGKSIAGLKGNVAIAIYAETNGDKVTLVVKRAASEDGSAFAAKALKTTPDKWESLGATINTEKVEYNAKKIDIHTITDKTDQYLKKFAFIMK